MKKIDFIFKFDELNLKLSNEPDKKIKIAGVMPEDIDLLEFGELKDLNEDLKISNLDKVFQVIIQSAIFELLYKPKTSIEIIIKDLETKQISQIRNNF